MAQMSTVPVFKCKYCHRYVKVTLLRTASPDPDGTLLHEMMRNLNKIAMCDECKRRYNYYSSQGKGQEFLEGRAF